MLLLKMMADMTLKKKILTGYGVAFTLMGLVVACSVANLVSLGKASDAILSENYRSILAAQNMVDALLKKILICSLLPDQMPQSRGFCEISVSPLSCLSQATSNHPDLIVIFFNSRDIQGHKEVIEYYKNPKVVS